MCYCIQCNDWLGYVVVFNLTKGVLFALLRLSHIWFIDEGGTVCALAPITYMVYWRRGYCLRSCAYPIYGLLTEGVLFVILRLSYIWFIDEGGTVCALAPIPYTVYITTSILTKKIKIFSRETHLFFKKKQILNVLRNLTPSFAFYSKIDTFNHFKKIQIFSGNQFIFSKNQKFFEHFEKSANFSCIPQQNCYLQSFQGKFIFGESMYFFKTAKKLNVLRNVSVSVEFYCKVATASHFLQFQEFFSKNLFFKIKRAWSLKFWGLLQFQSILRQVCCLCHFKRLQVFSENRGIL